MSRERATYIVYNANYEKTYGRLSTLEAALDWREQLLRDRKTYMEHEPSNIVVYEAWTVYPLG